MIAPVRGPSRTAVLTAAARALHREEPPPWILDDYLARELAGEEGRALGERLRAELSGPNLVAFSRWMCVRARFPEDIVEDAVAGGVRQYVILGAGLDSFAYRRADLLDRLRVFEVDQPATQAWKRGRLAELGLDQPGGVVFAPVDFERETLGEGLKAAGFDFSQRAVFSWIGVTMYLTLEAIKATLTTISACPPGSRIVLTYNLPKRALHGMGAQLRAELAPIMADLGEPWVSLFVPAEIERLLQEHDFEQIVHFGPQEAEATYFAGRSDAKLATPQRLIAATVAT